MEEKLFIEETIQYYIKEYQDALFNIKILINECKEILSFIKNGIDKLKFFIKNKKSIFNDDELPKLATSSIKVALFLRYGIEKFIYAIAFNNKDLIKIEKNDWNVHEFIKKLDKKEIDWTPKKTVEKNKLLPENKEELLKTDILTKKDIKNIYLKTSKIIHNTRPHYTINQKYKLCKYETNEQEIEELFKTVKNRSFIIKNEFNMLNSLCKKFYKALQNHYILINGGSILLVVADFRIIEMIYI